MNIVNGKLAAENANVHNALSIGESMALKFRNMMPLGFYDGIKSEVINLETTKKGVKLGNKTVYDIENLFARMLVISQKRDLDIQNIFTYELAPVPSSSFDEYGNMRKSFKSILLSKLAKLSDPPPGVDLEIYDGNEHLYHVNWPRGGTVHDFIERFVKSVSNKQHQVLVIFDCYRNQSIKMHERIRRDGGMHISEHDFQVNTPLPARETVMKSNKNKE